MGCGIDDEWLQKKIEEDLNAMADEREKQLMEMHELQNIQMPREKLEDIYREAERRRKVVRKKKIRYRMVAALAATLVLCVGAGVISSGNKVYVPEIFQREVGDDTTIKINNADAVTRGYDEEEICQEIEEKLGVIPIRFGYQPDGMALVEYWIKIDENEVILKYMTEKDELQVYISKDYKDSSINYHTDGEEIDTLIIASCGLEISVFKYYDSEKNTYFEADFEYLNTYYSIGGMINQEEYLKILENIIIKNV
ncbi:MAG: DUF4367 domain-containing protein [Lachnospiraceae bacterium]|jgi:hypothetical protein|nr:DUF4367 domain-containing protein [Lachnospiraceae bacterium]